MPCSNIENDAQMHQCLRTQGVHTAPRHTHPGQAQQALRTHRPHAMQDSRAITRRLTIVEGLFSGLSVGAGGGTAQMAAKIKLLVEAPAAVEDALASLLDSADSQLQVRSLSFWREALGFWREALKLTLQCRGWGPPAGVCHLQLQVSWPWHET